MWLINELCFKHEHSIAYVAYATTVFIIGLLLLQGSWSALRVPAFMLLERARILIFKPSVCHPEVLSPNLFFFLPGCPSVTVGLGLQVALCGLMVRIQVSHLTVLFFVVWVHHGIVHKNID